MDVNFKPKALLFDKDGTLIHHDESWADYVPELFGYLAADHKAIWQEMGQAVGFDFETGLFIPGSISVNGTFDEIIDVMAKFIGPISIEKALEADQKAQQNMQPVAVGALSSLLDRFRGVGLQLGVVTNDLIYGTELQIEKLGVRDRFDVIYCADSGPTPKPSGDVILAACYDLGVPVKDVVMVGDSTHDLRAGRAAGVGMNIGVLTGPASADDLGTLADIVLPDIHAIPEALNL